MRDARGFTLMEVMVAVGITAFMGAIVAISFTTTLKTREEVMNASDRYREIRAAFSRMEREIGSAFVSDRYDAERYRDQNDRPTNFIGERDRLLFTSFAHQRLYQNAKESDQMVVEYRLGTLPGSKKAGRQDLIRRENPIVQDRMDRGGTEDVLMEDVKKIQFEYWDSTKKEWDDEWDTRRVERKSILPTRVRVSIWALDENGKEVRYTTQIRIMLNTEIPRYD
ncbi:MAG: prepilin-type N-terminal cleavage/methylation domain-containing protein [Myxococcaceae bacterium]|nr:prepilin-type N-terminal cleavage/methylation domain-containing protein [Myxococcaceae bacterium]